VDAHRGHEHYRDHQRGSDRSEESERDEGAAGDLGHGGRAREPDPGAKAQLLEKSAGSAEPVAPEPSEELLAPVGHHERAQHQAGDEQAAADQDGVVQIRRVHM
jgi:hypothetical protein